MKFKYKNNHYMLMNDGTYRIRSLRGKYGYSWFYVEDEHMVAVLNNFVSGSLKHT